MGSSFSIVNDTDKPIWVRQSYCKEALFGTIGAVLSVVMWSPAAIEWLGLTESAAAIALEATTLKNVASVSTALNALQGWTKKHLTTDEQKKVKSFKAYLKNFKKVETWKVFQVLCHSLTGQTRCKELSWKPSWMKPL